MRVDPALRREIELAAQDDGRTITSYVLRATREKLSRDRGRRRALELEPATASTPADDRQLEMYDADEIARRAAELERLRSLQGPR